MAEEKSDLYALLIGADYYFPNSLPDGGRYGHLHGCVRDVERMASFLKARLAVPDKNNIRLTASHGGADAPAEEPSLWPTYENIIGGFQRVIENARPGDQVVIHYSGHGGRATSIYPPEVKSSGIDEAFVPADIGSDAARYVRDLELAHLLHTMTERGLVVTALLDCCHSGGMTRGDPPAVARGIDAIDSTVRRTDTLAAPDADALLATWRQLTGGTRAATPLTPGGLPASDDWVVLTACRPQELAYEYKFDGQHKSGALTHWLLEALQGGGMALSYKQLHQRVLARVQAQFARQRPQLYGDGSRAIFGHNRVQAQFAVPVLKVDDARGEVVLNAGIAQGVRRGAQFAIFPLDATDLGDFDSAAARVTVKEDGATASQAAVDEVTEGEKIEPGAQAVLINPASVRLRSYARLQAEDEGALPQAAQAALRTAHATADFGRFVEWVGADAPADFIVAGMKGFYEIWDPGGEIIPRINPPLALSDEEAPAKVIERLIHLTRYRNVQQLANNDSRARGAPSVTFEWLDVPGDHTFADGNVARLLVRNDSPQDVEVTVLHLAPDWRIEQFYPADASDSYTFAPGETDTLELDVFVGGDEEEETSIFKLCATLQGTNFRMLELPTLDEPMTRRAGTRSPANELEELLSQVVETAPSTRAVRLRTSAGREWTTAQVELRVRR
jgi:hypothetical protein